MVREQSAADRPILACQRTLRPNVQFPAMATASRRPRKIEPPLASPAARGRSVATNAGIVAGAFIASRILGLLREVIIARQFGTSANYDAYVAAFRIPDLLFLVVMSGAFGAAFIPVFAGFLTRGERERAWQLASAVLSYTVATLVGVGFVVLLFAGPLVRYLVASGLPPEQLQLATNLTRLLLLSPLLLGLGAAGKGMLEAQDAFTVAAMAPILYNLGIIGGALFLAPRFGVYGLAGGVIAGAAAHAGTQFVALLRRGLRFRPTLDSHVAGLREVGRLMLPRLVGQAAFQVNFIVMTNFASRLPNSPIAALNYAYQLFMLPHGVLALSLSTVIFPTMARLYEEGRLREMNATLSSALGPLLFLTIPSAIGLDVFRTSIIQVIFQHGDFSAQSTAMVAEALQYFALGLVAFAVVEAVTRAFYAMHDTRTPVVAGVTAVVANVALSAILAPRMGHGGLALSISLTTTVEMVILLVVLARRTGGIDRQLPRELLKMLAAALILFLAGRLFAAPLARATDPRFGRSLLGYLGFFFTLGAVGSSYLVAAYYLRVPELRLVLERVRARLSI